MLGRILLQDGQIPEAIEACKTALELSPESASVHFDLARALFANQDCVEAANHFAEVIEIAENSDYGIEAVAYLQTINNDSSVVPPRADLEPNRFAGTPFESASARAGVL